jgi:sulfur carrier protein
VRIILNFADAEFPETELSIEKIMELRRYSFPLIISRLNGVIVPREARASAFVYDGDEVELYHLVSGG